MARGLVDGLVNGLSRLRNIMLHLTSNLVSLPRGLELLIPNERASGFLHVTNGLCCHSVSRHLSSDFDDF